MDVYYFYIFTIIYGDNFVRQILFKETEASKCWLFL